MMYLHLFIGINFHFGDIVWRCQNINGKIYKAVCTVSHTGDSLYMGITRNVNCIQTEFAQSNQTKPTANPKSHYANSAMQICRIF